MEEYIYRIPKHILSSANNEELLDKALEHGEINLIEYPMETRYFYEAINRSLEAEKNYNQASSIVKISTMKWIHAIERGKLPQSGFSSNS